MTRSTHAARGLSFIIAGLLITSSGWADEAPPPEATPPAPQTAAEPVAPAAPPIELSGFLDGYYGYNANKVSPALHNFDLQHNTFELAQAELAFEKKVTTASRGGFRVDFDFGPTANAVTAFEPASNGQDIFKHVEQAYVSFLAGSKVQLDLGKYVTPHGAEVIEAKDNWNYTRSLLFALAIPYYHCGVRATVNASEKATVLGFVTNGWNNCSQNTGNKDFGLGLNLKPTPKFNWIANVMAGKEGIDPTGTRVLFDTTAILTATPKLSLMANYDYGQDKISGQGVKWQGVAAYAKYQATETFALVPRIEWLDDSDGFMTGTSQKLKELTLTSEYKLGDFVGRLDVRHDFGDTPFFKNDKGELKKSQTTLTVGVVYGFGGKI